jgi:hypothetical protein
MSQLFGFPSGLSGGSKETSHGTVHSTQKSTAYDSHFNTNYNSDFNTDVSTDHTSTWNTVGGWNQYVTGSGVPRVWPNGGNPEILNHQGVALNTISQSNLGYINFEFQFKGPMFQGTSPYNYDYNHYSGMGRYSFTLSCGSGGQSTAYHVLGANSVDLNSLFDGCSQITDTQGNMLPQGSGGFRTGGGVNEFNQYMSDHTTLRMNYPSSQQYAYPHYIGRWQQLWTYDSANIQSELRPDSNAQNGTGLNLTYTLTKTDAQVHFEACRKQLHLMKFILDRLRDQNLPDISSYYQKIDYSGTSISSYDPSTDYTAIDSVFAAGANGAGWFPIGWWLKNLDLLCADFRFNNPVLAINGADAATQAFPWSGILNEPYLYIRNNMSSQYAILNNWLLPTYNRPPLQYVGASYDWNSPFQTSYTSSRTTQKITTRNTDRSTLRNTTKNTATDTNYTTEYITYG